MHEHHREAIIAAEKAYQEAEAARVRAWSLYEDARHTRDQAGNERDEIISAAQADGVGLMEIAMLVPDLLPREVPRETRSVIFSHDSQRDRMDVGRLLLWVQVADQIAIGIKDRTYPPGTALPVLNELAARFKVSNVTVRHAIKALREQNLLTRRGNRIYVCADIP